MCITICKTDSHLLYGNLLYDAGTPKQVNCDSLEGWDGEEGGREVQEEGDICIPMTDSC